MISRKGLVENRAAQLLSGLAACGRWDDRSVFVSFPRSSLGTKALAVLLHRTVSEVAWNYEKKSTVSFRVLEFVVNLLRLDQIGFHTRRKL